MPKKVFLLAVVLMLVCFTACKTNTQQEDESESGESTTLQAADKVEEEFGLSPLLDYSSDKRIVFHDYLGVFVYSLEEEKLLHTFSLNQLGYKIVQGDGAVQVRYDEANNTVGLCSLEPENIKAVHLSSGTVEKIDKQTFDQFPDENPQGSMDMEGYEIKAIYYQPQGGGKKYYPLKDWDGGK